MTQYIENLNLYLNARKIKQTYLSMKTGIEVEKISGIVDGAQDITETENEKEWYWAGAWLHFGKIFRFFLGKS